MQQPGRPVSGPARGSPCRRLLRSSSCACSVALVRRSRRRQSFSAGEEGAPALLERNTRQQAPFHNLYEEIGRPFFPRRCHGTPGATWHDRALRSWTLTRRRRSMGAARFFLCSRPQRRCTNRQQWRRHPPVSLDRCHRVLDLAVACFQGSNWRTADSSFSATSWHCTGVLPIPGRAPERRSAWQGPRRASGRLHSCRT